MKRHTVLSLLILSFSIGLNSCTFTVENEDHHTAMGEIAEIALFSDSRTLGELNTEIRDCLSPITKSLSSPERAFKLRIAKEGVLKGYHKKNYVLFILVHSNNWSDIQHQFDEKYIRVVNRFLGFKTDTSFMISDPWAAPQKVVFLVSKNLESMREFLVNKKDGLFETALDAERKSTIKRLLRKKKTADDFFQDMMATRKFAYRKPALFNVVVRADSFIGYKRYVKDKEIGVYSYFEEYRSQDQFTKEYIIEKRNQIMKRHVQGADAPDGKTTYVTTDSEDNVPISIKETSINGQFAIETRGWYTMVNGFFGGPFVSYTIYSEKLNRVITIEGVVHAPNRAVTKYLREVELLASTYEE
jgi:hypothetical protein